jgi:endonuclease/exonuclease/phosphatase family metal-dependent hydrolase
LQPLFARTIDHQGGLYGNTILTRLPVNLFANYQLPFTAGREARGVGAINVAVDGEVVRFLATHLDVTEADRLPAIPSLDTAAGPELPAIRAGDLNALPDSEVLDRVRRNWSVAGGIAPTFPARQPTRQIDYVLFRPAHRWRVIEVKVIDEAVASDHRLLLAIVELLPHEGN